MFSTVRSITASIGRMTLGQGLKPQTTSIVANSQVNHNFLQAEKSAPSFEVPCRGVRFHFKGHRRNSPLFYHYLREKRHLDPLAWMLKTTRSKRLKGHIDVWDKQGKREALVPAVERFKRLDFGVYISTMVGRNNKVHQKSPGLTWRHEQHVFTWLNFW